MALRTCHNYILNKNEHQTTVENEGDILNRPIQGKRMDRNATIKKGRKEGLCVCDSI
jgi:hypothetical protein